MVDYFDGRLIGIAFSVLIFLSILLLLIQALWFDCECNHFYSKIYANPDAFCPDCGEELFGHCPECGKAYSRKTSYCYGCGFKFQESEE